MTALFMRTVIVVLVAPAAFAAPEGPPTVPALPPCFEQSVSDVVERLVDRMVEQERERRARRRAPNVLGSPLTSSAPSNWWNWPLTGGVDSVANGDAPTDGPSGP